MINSGELDRYSGFGHFYFSADSLGQGGGDESAINAIVLDETEEQASGSANYNQEQGRISLLERFNVWRFQRIINAPPQRFILTLLGEDLSSVRVGFGIRKSDIFQDYYAMPSTYSFLVYAFSDPEYAPEIFRTLASMLEIERYPGQSRSEYRQIKEAGCSELIANFAFGNRALIDTFSSDEGRFFRAWLVGNFVEIFDPNSKQGIPVLMDQPNMPESSFDLQSLERELIRQNILSAEAAYIYLHSTDIRVIKNSDVNEAARRNLGDMGVGIITFFNGIPRVRTGYIVSGRENAVYFYLPRSGGMNVGLRYEVNESIGGRRFFELSGEQGKLEMIQDLLNEKAGRATFREVIHFLSRCCYSLIFSQDELSLTINRVIEIKRVPGPWFTRRYQARYIDRDEIVFARKDIIYIEEPFWGSPTTVSHAINFPVRAAAPYREYDDANFLNVEREMRQRIGSEIIRIIEREITRRAGNGVRGSDISNRTRYQHELNRMLDEVLHEGRSSPSGIMLSIREVVDRFFEAENRDMFFEAQRNAARRREAREETRRDEESFRRRVGI